MGVILTVNLCRWAQPTVGDIIPGQVIGSRLYNKVS